MSNAVWDHLKNTGVFVGFFSGAATMILLAFVLHKMTSDQVKFLEGFAAISTIFGSGLAAYAAFCAMKGIDTWRRQISYKREFDAISDARDNLELFESKYDQLHHFAQAIYVSGGILSNIEPVIVQGYEESVQTAERLLDDLEKSCVKLRTMLPRNRSLFVELIENFRSSIRGLKYHATTPQLVMQTQHDMKALDRNYIDKRFLDLRDQLSDIQQKMR